MNKDYLSIQAANVVRNAIINGEMELGEALSEDGICKRFKLSKTPVREALNLLVHEGLIQKHSRRGSFVFEITMNEIEEIADFRFLLELYALNKSLKKNKSELIEILSKNVVNQKKACKKKDYNKFLVLDTEFHKSFFVFLNNSTIVKTYGMLLNKSQALRVLVVKEAVDNGLALEQHIKIVESLKKNNSKIIEESLSNHLVEWVAKYRKDYKISIFKEFTI